MYDLLLCGHNGCQSWGPIWSRRRQGPRWGTEHDPLGFAELSISRSCRLISHHSPNDTCLKLWDSRKLQPCDEAVQYSPILSLLWISWMAPVARFTLFLYPPRSSFLWSYFVKCFSHKGWSSWPWVFFHKEIYSVWMYLEGKYRLLGQLRRRVS